MIGYIQGQVIDNDGVICLIKTDSGIGYEIKCSKFLSPGQNCEFFISHIFKEADQELYGFLTMKEKKFFELLLSVKGVGPKSAFALVSGISIEQISRAIITEDKKTLSSVPGIGAKAAAQIILDLAQKIQKFDATTMSLFDKKELTNEPHIGSLGGIVEEAIMACKELGYKDEQAAPLAKKLMANHQIAKAQDLVQLMLKEL